MRRFRRTIAVTLAVALLVLTPVTTAAAANVIRLSDTNRYAGAVAIAAHQFDQLPAADVQWPTTMRHIVIASGEDRAAADPLAAAGLCGLYNAPLLLVNSTSVDFYVKQTIKDIVWWADDTVTLHVVGGTTSVPQARINEIIAFAGPGITYERLTSGGDRYDLAAAIARRVASAWPSGEPPVVLMANGADPTKFFDALALSPISSSRVYPVLLVKYDDVPDATLAALGDIDDDANIEVIVGGGPATVSGDVYDFFDDVTVTQRWYGATRYETALSIANNAVARGWLSRTYAGTAAKLPDALTGGAMLGLNDGPLVLTNGAALTGSTGAWLETYKAQINTFYVFGGIYSVTPSTVNQIDTRLD